MTLSGDSYQSRAGVDPIHQKFMLQAIASQYLGNSMPSDPLASPLFGELSGLPPLLLQVGDCEIGLDDSRAFAERAKAAGVRVSLSVWTDMIHVFQQFAASLPEGQQAINEIADFLNSQWDGAQRSAK